MKKKKKKRKKKKLFKRSADRPEQTQVSCSICAFDLTFRSWASSKCPLELCGIRKCPRRRLERMGQGQVDKLERGWGGLDRCWKDFLGNIFFLTTCLIQQFTKPPVDTTILNSYLPSSQKLSAPKSIASPPHHRIGAPENEARAKVRAKGDGVERAMTRRWWWEAYHRRRRNKPSETSLLLVVTLGLVFLWWGSLGDLSGSQVDMFENQ